MRLKLLSLNNRNFLAALIVLDIVMALSALYVDFDEFFAVPWYLILFVPICPLYPLLLSLNFFRFFRVGNFSQPLLHFTLIGMIGYGIMAYIFYPAYLFSQGFAWYEIGNIFWVTMYAAQTFLLLPYIKKISFLWYAPMVSYFLLKDFLDRFGGTFSYQRLEIFPENTANMLFLMILSLHFLAFFFIFGKSKNYSPASSSSVSNSSAIRQAIKSL